MRCAIYARYSTRLQDKTSAIDQITKATEYALARGWSILPDHVYRDEEVSAASLEDRPQMRALLTAAESKRRPFDLILTEDSSRVSRNVADASRFRERMAFAGVTVVFIAQGIATDQPESELLLNVHSWMDSDARTKDGRRSLRGRQGQMSRNYATGGRTFGYRSIPTPEDLGRRADGRPLGWTISKHPEEAATVRLIFERYAAGLGVGRVTDELNRAQVLGPRGRHWTYGAVRRVLCNQRYLGYQILGQRRFMRRPGTRFRVARAVPEDQWLRKERPDLSIVDKVLWQRVQDRLLEAAKTARRQTDSNLLRGRAPEVHARHLFSGFLKCAQCGGAMAIVAGGHGSPRYGCRSSWRHGRTTCPNRLTVRAKVAEPILLSALQTQLRSPQVVAYVTDVVTARVAGVLDEGPRRRRRLEAQRASV